MKKLGVAGVFTEEVSGPCPFCHGKFSAGYDDQRTPSVLHSLPPCDEFTKNEADRFLELVRKRLSS